ncbi:MAG: hypothetical protein ABIH48_01915 [Candidatus Falkowbacteria bacterium]
MEKSESHEIIVQNVCNYTCKLLKYPKLQIKIMRRTREVKKNASYVMGHTSIGKNTVTLDIYTARLRKPKKISSILSVLAHEIAHHQKPPYRQWHKGHWIVRQHFPRFYKRVNKNVAIMKKDKLIGKYFV